MYVTRAAPREPQLRLCPTLVRIVPHWPTVSIHAPESSLGRINNTQTLGTCTASPGSVADAPRAACRTGCLSDRRGCAWRGITNGPEGESARAGRTAVAACFGALVWLWLVSASGLGCPWHGRAAFPTTAVAVEKAAKKARRTVAARRAVS